MLSYSNINQISGTILFQIASHPFPASHDATQLLFHPGLSKAEAPLGAARRGSVAAAAAGLAAASATRIYSLRTVMF